MVYSVVVPARASGRPQVFVVDTGFASGRSMTGREFADFETPAEILGKVELEPKDVTTILLTHLHFDHAGNIGAFKNATILLQRCEYEGWKRVLRLLPEAPAGKQNWTLSSMNPHDLIQIDRAIADGRLTLIDGVHEVSPGLNLRLAADSHTFGSQWIEILTPEGPYVLAGDVIASYANVERMWPPGYHQGNCWNLLAAYREVQNSVGQAQWHRIVPGHDMELFRRMSSWNAGCNPVAEVHVAPGQRSYVQRI
jgi:glyoxylase-like metal-dependent hydrolase (beta-lactamase superfamily II)